MSNTIAEPFQLLVCSVGIAKSNTPAFSHNNYKILTVEFVRKGSGYVEHTARNNRARMKVRAL